MPEPRITVDPDGTRWVSVDLTPEQFAMLEHADNFREFCRLYNMAIRHALREYAFESVDKMAAEMSNPKGA